MRLVKKEIDTIHNYSTEIFGSCRVYLFGSRIDGTKIGGDIDLYVVPVCTQELFRKKLLLKAKLEDILYKPVDIVVARDKNREIEKEAIMNGVLIT